ncbi:MAG: isoprenylcysteine carboxylmethyltransferase family protein [Spirochaetes bacterium]|nr:isoprenylcysteine carboxylmethyltransferase family protein [Spirochaetota bacterium]
MTIFDWIVFGTMTVFYALFLGKTIILRIGGTRPFVLGKNKKGARAVFELILFPGFLLWTFEAMTHSLHVDAHVFGEGGYGILFDSIYFKITGAVLVSAAILLFVAALFSFGASWRIGIDKRRAGGLVTTGVFALTRNPIFLFLDVYMVGIFLIYSNCFFLCAAAAAISLIHFQILEEEKFLISHYGDSYREYMQRVPRYLFFHMRHTVRYTPPAISISEKDQ